MFPGTLYTQIDRYPRAAGLPDNGKFIATSNSEIGRLACTRKYLFGYVEDLRSPPSLVMELGTAWHEVVEDVFWWWAFCDTGYPDEGMDRCPFCRGTCTVDEETGIWHGKEHFNAPCPRCTGTGHSALHRAMVPFQKSVDAGELSDLERDEVEDTLRRMLEGYLEKWQSGPLDTIRIVDVEVPLARQVVNPCNGLPFRPEVLLEQQADGTWALAGVGAVHRAERGVAKVMKARWPWYQVGTLDVLGCDRVTKAAWVIDCKGTGQPGRYQKGMGVDPQLPGYCWLLEPHLDYYRLQGVAGFMYDIAHTKNQPDPHELKWAPPKMEDLRAMAEAKGIKVTGRKSEDYCQALGIVPSHGGFSLAQNSGVPSWRYEWAIQRAGIDRTPYADHIQMLAETVDPHLYLRPWQRYDEGHRSRYSRELYAKCVQMHLLRKAATACESEEALDVLFPRTPVCLSGAGCGYSDICAQDGETARSGYNVTPAQKWSENPPAQLSLVPTGTIEQPEIDW